MTMQAHLHGVVEIRCQHFIEFKCVYLTDPEGNDVKLFIRNQDFDRFAGQMLAALGHRSGVTLSLPADDEPPAEDQVRMLRTVGGV